MLSYILSNDTASGKKAADYFSDKFDDLTMFAQLECCANIPADAILFMVGKYKVITLCESTRFKNEFLNAQKRLALKGNFVISVGLLGHSGDNEAWIEGTKEMLDDMHKRKIDMADEIYVINVDGYIGSNTKSESEYAIATGKTVKYLEEAD